MRRYRSKLYFSFAISFTITLQGFSQNYSQKDKGLVTYKLGADTATVQYFDYDNRKFHTTIFTFTGSVTKYEGDGELDKDGDLKEILSKIYTVDSAGQWTLT